MTVARDRIFGLDAVTSVSGVPDRLLLPQQAWSDEAAWERAARTLAAKFRANFRTYAEYAGAEVLAAGPIA